MPPASQEVNELTRAASASWLSRGDRLGSALPRRSSQGKRAKRIQGGAYLWGVWWRLEEAAGAPEVLLAYQGAGYMGKCGNSLSCVYVGFPGYVSLSQKFSEMIGNKNFITPT